MRFFTKIFSNIFFFFENLENFVNFGYVKLGHLWQAKKKREEYKNLQIPVFWQMTK